MVSHRVAGAPLDFGALRAELAVPGGFAAEVQADADAAARDIALPEYDASDIPFVTIDPRGSRDLDQALHIARDGDGYLVSYAIADIAACVRPGDLVDDEAWQRGQTLYFPDLRVPLHPATLSEGAASLLPEQTRAALLWRMTLDNDANPTHVDVRRASVRSRAQLDYTGTQAALDSANPPPLLTLLAEVGTKRLALARARHAINLDLPEQVVTDSATGWQLSVRRPLPVEAYNSEISLLTGMCAAQLMLAHDIGVLRTVPDPEPGAIHSLRRAARALGIAWPDDALPGDVLATLDRGNSHHVALIEQAASLLRGAGYSSFLVGAPAQRTHAGIGAPYAHVTAPLRRLVDRYAGEVCVALAAGDPVPAWARDRLSELPAVMQVSDQRAHQVDRAVVDTTEAWLLRDRIGERFAAIVLDANEHAATIMLDVPAVRARCDGANLPVGERVTVRLTEADVSTRTVRFEVSTTR